MWNLQDPIEQRKQLGQDVGKAVPPGGIYPLEVRHTFPASRLPYPARGHQTMVLCVSSSSSGVYVADHGKQSDSAK